jgi:brefeldin A-resistance guanine nucleotide exchange factor 1
MLLISLKLSRSQLDSEALVAAVRAIEALAHDRSIARLGAQSEDVPPLDDEVLQLPYDPASVFLLEIMVSITNQAPQYIEELWYVVYPLENSILTLPRPIVFEHISTLLSSSIHYSILLIERAVVCLMRLSQILVQKV